MTIGFVGTSALRAATLVRFGWHEQLATSGISAARSQARLHSVLDGTPPVVVLQRAVETGAVFEVYEIYNERGETARARLGFPETAGIGTIITSILDGAHKHLRNALDIGGGNKNIELPSLKNTWQSIHPPKTPDDDDDDDDDVFKPAKESKSKKPPKAKPFKPTKPINPSAKPKVSRARKSTASVETGAVPTFQQMRRAHRIGMNHINSIKATLDEMLKRSRAGSVAKRRVRTAQTKRIAPVPRIKAASLGE